MLRASALRRRGSVHLQREYRCLRSTTLKKLLATSCCGDGRWPMAWPAPFRRSVRTAHGADFRINWPRPCKARARGGKPRSLWRRISLRKRLRFARNGGHHRNARRIGGSCLSDGAVSQAYIVIVWLFFLRKTTLESALYDQDSLCEIS